MALSFSRVRSSAAARQEFFAIATGGVLALLAVVRALLAWVLSRVTRPIRDMTTAMDRLSAGEFEKPGFRLWSVAMKSAPWPARWPCSRRNSIERQRLEFLDSQVAAGHR